MAEILPFIGTRYNSQLIGNLSKVLAPPYDAITQEMQDELYARHDFNVVRLELAKEDASDEERVANKYALSANFMKTWRSDGILIEDEKPAFYLYEQEFKLPNGEARKRRGFFALVKLEDARSAPSRDSGQAEAAAKADRLKLLRATKANLSPILTVYNDPEGAVLSILSQRMDGEKPWEEATDDGGIVHRLWVVQRKDFVDSLMAALKDKRLFIAEGHYRYETALAYRDEQRQATGKANGKQPFDYMMTFVTDAEQDGLVLQPIHRVMSKNFIKEVDLKEAMEELRETFTVEPTKVDLAEPDAEAARLLESLRALGESGPAFAMVLADGKGYLLSMKPDADPVELIDDDDDMQPAVKRLDVSILHHHVINQVMVGNPEFELEEDDCAFTRDAARALALLKAKKASIAFLMNPTRMEQVIEIISSGHRMPHKSTYFHPKAISGLVLRNMECEERKAVKAPKAAKR